MSLILEALKKSEQQRRLGEAPTLGSPMLATRRKRSWLPLFGALIVIALGAGWWLTRTPDTGADQPLATAPPPAPASTPPPATAAHAPAPAGNGRAAAPNARSPDAPVAPPEHARSPNATARLQTQTPPAPVQRHPAAPAATAAPPPAAAPPAPAVVPKPVPEPAPAKVDAPVVPTPPPAAPPAAPAAPPRPQQPALPSVWELPYATRKDLPELNLTMHVYSDDPRDRFVVIKGERHVEGDTLGDGLTLREIRPDGMVLEFKGQRFVYPRDGR